MMIIAFSTKTSKILPRILCRHFRHCAPIMCDKSHLVMYQFVRLGHIEQIQMRPRDIKILAQHGWVFVYLSPHTPTRQYDFIHAYSCVDLTKRAINMHNIFIQTPDRLYKYLTQK